MNIEKLLQPEIQDFIYRHPEQSGAGLVLRASQFPGWPIKEVAQQLDAKQKAKHKLPTWYNTKNIIYPTPLSVEQSSSEKTAAYKSSLVSGKSLIDITGGMGVDSLAFSNVIDSITYCELNSELATISTHNFKAFKATNIRTISGNGIDILKEHPTSVDWVYIDPARRDANQNKVHFLADCEPNVVEHLQLFFTKTNNILIKTSPLLDIKQAIRDLIGVKEVHIISLQNECKEVLYILEKGYTGEPTIYTINSTNNGLDQFSFSFQKEENAEVNLSLPKKFLYEPNSSILKAGGFKSIANKHNVFKLHMNSHLYTSDKLLEDFPGRKFKLVAESNLNKKELKKLIPEGKANITTRNYPSSVSEIRKKTNLKEGGKVYLFCTTLVNDKKTGLICRKTNYSVQ